MFDLDEIIENLKSRDYIDTHRSESPLVQAPDAYFLDTSFLTIDEQVEYVLQLATSKIIEKNKTTITTC
jgi:cytidylate kinase